MILNDIKYEIGHVISGSDVLGTRMKQVFSIYFVGRIYLFTVQNVQLGQFEHHRETIVFYVSNRIVYQVQVAKQVEFNQVFDFFNVAYLENERLTKNDFIRFEKKQKDKKSKNHFVVFQVNVL
jgi:hypothetical protein